MKFLHTFLIMCGLWLLFSGYFTAMLLILGVMSCWVTTKLIFDLDIHDHYSMYPRFLGRVTYRYLPWLMKEIVKSNFSVAYHIWHPRMPISPSISFVRPTQKSELGLVTFANSITLTPGTLSIDVEEDGIEVHSMTRDIARALLASDMNQRVTDIEAR